MPTPTPTDADRVPWPSWAKQLLVGSLSAGAMLVVMTLRFAAVQADAEKGACLEPRVAAVESHANMLDTRGTTRYESILAAMAAAAREADQKRVELRSELSEIRGDIKEILRRVK